MTSLPSRLAGIGPAIRSIVAQERRPDRLVLSLPRRSEREGRAYELTEELEGLLAEHPWIVVQAPERDHGPGTKLLGALEWLASAGAPPGPSDVLMVLDDDHEYLPCALGELLQQALAKRGVVSYFAYFMRGIMVPQGADVIALPIGTGIGSGAAGAAEAESSGMRLDETLRRFHADFVDGDRSCFLVDDLWIGLFLHTVGVQVSSLRELVVGRGLQTIYRRTDNAKVGALESLTGEDRRDRVTLRAFDSLLARLLAVPPERLAPFGGAAASRRLQRLASEVRQVEARIAQLSAWLVRERGDSSSGEPSDLARRAEDELRRLRHLYQMQAPPGG